jgi:RNA polymerase sigma factor (sigma-70 family)
MVNEVYDHFGFLRRLTEKRFSDSVLADEAHTFAFEELSKDDWRRVRAYRGKSSFRSYLGCVWSRLLEDFSIKKFGKITPPQWIRRLGGVWEELFKLLCRRRLSSDETIEKIIDGGRYNLSAKELVSAVEEILAQIPNCGQMKGPAFSMDDEEVKEFSDSAFNDENALSGELIIQKEKWIALKALAKIFLKRPDGYAWDNEDSQRLNTLIVNIRKRLPLTPEEQLILTAHFVDGLSVTDIGRRLGYNSNQIHGRFRRLMARMQKTLPDLLKPYFD